MSTPQQRSPDVIVIGAGAIGLACSWRAAQRGLDVLLLERDEPGAGASGVAAGMLAPVSEATFGEQALVEPALESAARWPAFAEELRSVAAIDPGYRQCGALLVARDRDEAEALEREFAFRTSLGLEVERLAPSAARGLEPALAPTVRRVLSVPGDHAVDPAALLRALLAAARAAGVVLRTHAHVAELIVEGGRAIGVRLEDGDHIAAERIVVAAGSWSSLLGGIPAEAAVPVRPVKGQILRLRDPAGPGLLERVLRLGGSYIVPRGDGRYVLGATVEERGYDTAVTAGALHDMLRDAAEVVPGLLELELEAAVAGLRPGTPDNAPAIGRGALAGLHWATGHYRNGLLLTPLTADLVAATVAGEPGELGDFDGVFAPERFALQVAP